MLRLTTLGAIDLRDRLGRPVRDVLSQPKRIALLLHLAVEGRRGPVARDRVLAMFWPESDEARARNALSQALYHLRQAIGADLIVGQGPTLALGAEGLWCDALVLEDAIAADDAELALDLYKGEFCPALLVSGASAVEDWVSETRRDQRRRLLELARRGVQRSTAARDTAAAARLARRAMLLVPDDERDVRDYLTAIDAGGDVTGAISLYTEYARRIAIDLETEPSPETVALIDRIRRRRSAAIAAAPADDAEPVAPNVPAAPDEPIAAPSLLRRMVLAAAAVALLVALGITAGAGLGSAADQVGDPDAPSAIAVFPFTVRGDGGTNMLADGLAVLLAAKLDGTEDVRAIDPRSATNAAEGRTPDPQHADDLSRALGARYFVLGDLIERAGRLQMDGALFATGRPDRAIASASVEGDTTALFALVDALAGRLLSTILPGRDSSLTKLAAVTTSSLPALKAYLRGERAMREGQDARAAGAFREAALLDTNFALAQYRLALVANWVAVSGIDDPLVWARTAARHDERLTPLGRDLVEAFLAYKVPSSTTAARYLAIVQAYPDNVEAWYMYGEALFHYGPILGGPAADARSAFERVLVLDPANSHALVHLARIAALEGRVDELASIAARHRATHADADRTIETRALLAWARHDTAAARAILTEARNADAVVVYGLVQAAALYAGNLADARQLAQQLTVSGSFALMQPYGRAMLSETTLGAGQWTPDRAIAPRSSADVQWQLESEVLLAVEPILATARERLLSLRARIDATRPFRGIGVPSRPLPRAKGAIAGETMRLHLLGLLDVRLGESAAARARIDSLSALAARSDSTQVLPFAMSLRAELLRSEGKLAEALSELERFPFEFRDERLAHYGVRERFARGELLVALHRDDEALRWYGSYPAFYDLGFVAPSRFREGQLYERIARRAEARASYARFVSLWEHADPSVQPLVREARAALARLR